jgi:hypothetical protein
MYTEVHVQVRYPRALVGQPCLLQRKSADRPNMAGRRPVIEVTVHRQTRYLRDRYLSYTQEPA